MTPSHLKPLMRASVSVREIETRDGAVLLDVQQGICLSLTPVAAKIWRLLKLNHSLDQIADHIASEFQAPRDQVYADAKEFLGHLSQQGLLISGDQKPQTGRLIELILRFHRRRARSQNHSKDRKKGTRFLFWKAISAFVAFDVLGFNKSFAALHNFVKSWITLPGNSDPDAVDRVCKALNLASVWYPKQVLCLQRSAVATCLLRNCCVPAQMVIGAQKFPFRAHAWTEVGGRTVNERRNVHDIYLVWERC
jgi:hypothetical protein